MISIHFDEIATFNRGLDEVNVVGLPEDEVKRGVSRSMKKASRLCSNSDSYRAVRAIMDRRIVAEWWERLPHW